MGVDFFLEKIYSKQIYIKIGKVSQSTSNPIPFVTSLTRIKQIELRDKSRCSPFIQYPIESGKKIKYTHQHFRNNDVFSHFKWLLWISCTSFYCFSHISHSIGGTFCSKLGKKNPARSSLYSHPPLSTEKKNSRRKGQTFKVITINLLHITELVLHIPTAKLMWCNEMSMRHTSYLSSPLLSSASTTVLVHVCWRQMLFIFYVFNSCLYEIKLYMQKWPQKSTGKGRHW